MVDTLQTLLIALFVLVPGYVGDRAYRELVGPGKSEGMREVVVWLVFSLLSGAIYSGIASATREYSPIPDLPLLEYAQLARIGTEDQSVIPPHWFLTLAIHTAMAFLLGVGLGMVGRRWDLFGLGYRFQTTWDHLITRVSPERYVLVEREDGSLLVGVLHITTRMSDPPDRDIVVRDPRTFSFEEGLSDVDDRAYLYLPADEVRSLAFITNSDDITRRATDAERQQGKPERKWFTRRERR